MQQKNKNKPHWSVEELDILNKYYISDVDKCIEKLQKLNPKRNRLNITTKANRLGLTRDRNRLWTPEEVNILKEYFRSDINKCNEILQSPKYKRSPISIMAKAKELELEHKTNLSKWTKKEIDILNEYYLSDFDKCVEEIRKINDKRRTESIIYKAKRLGLKIPHNISWTDEEIDILKKEYHCNIGQCINKLQVINPNRKVSHIGLKAKELGLKRTRCKPWTDEEIYNLKKYYSSGIDACVQEIQKINPDRKQAQIILKIKNLGLKAPRLQRAQKLQVPLNAQSKLKDKPIKKIEKTKNKPIKPKTPHKTKLKIKHASTEQKNKKIWADEELNILKKYYSSDTNKCIEEIQKINPNRSSLSIKIKAKDIGLTHRSFYYWKPEELEIIRSTYNIDFNKCVKAINKINPKRTVDSIKNKAKELNVIQIIGKDWSEEELNILKTYYSSDINRCIEEIQKINPNRSKANIITKANRLGLTRRLNYLWSEEELNILKTYYSSDINRCVQEIQKINPNRKRAQIILKAGALELVNKPCQSWLKEELDILKKYYVSDIDKCVEKIQKINPNRSKNKIIYRANQLGLSRHQIKKKETLWQK